MAEGHICSLEDLRAVWRDQRGSLGLGAVQLSEGSPIAIGAELCAALRMGSCV